MKESRVIKNKPRSKYKTGRYRKMEKSNQDKTSFNRPPFYMNQTAGNNAATRKVNNLTVAEKIETMTPEEVAYFFFNVFTTESFIDDYYCEKCKKRNDGCPVGLGECVSSSINLVNWILEQPYDEVVQRLDK